MQAKQAAAIAIAPTSYISDPRYDASAEAPLKIQTARLKNF
jgi:hypothetical protein